MNAPAQQGQQQPFYWTLALAWLNSLPIEVREGYANSICDTLGAYPKMFRAAPEEAPRNVLCVVRVGSASPPLYVLATHDGESWKRSQPAQSEDHTIRDVTAWAVLPS